MILIAGVLEVLWPIGMKFSENFTKPLWVAGMIAALITSFVLMSVATSPKFALPIGTAYAVWTGMGAAGAVLAGIMLFKEPADWVRLAFLSMIIIGIVGLKFTHQEQPEAAGKALEQKVIDVTQ
jgi:quaternary ammonium compound-resistance protein SugE